jgi:hypothetical protein
VLNVMRIFCCTPLLIVKCTSAHSTVVLLGLSQMMTELVLSATPFVIPDTALLDDSLEFDALDGFELMLLDEAGKLDAFELLNELEVSVTVFVNCAVSNPVAPLME